MQTLSSIIGFRGRATRRHFWIAHAIGKVIFVAALMGASARVFKNGIQNTPMSDALEAVPDVAPMLIVAYLASAIIGLTAAGRRLHDRDKPATWLILFFAPVSMLLGALVFGGWLAAYHLAGSLPFAIAANVINVWYYFELGLMKGTNGPNRYDDASKRTDTSAAADDSVMALAGAGAAMEAAIQRHKAALATATTGTASSTKKAAQAGFGRRAVR